MKDKSAMELLEELEGETANAARIYDYYLGGHHNTNVDRIAAEATIRQNPIVRYSAKAGRQVLQRFTKTMCEMGITQFLDLGSGLPTMGNVHDIAMGINPDAHIVYIDHDETVYKYSRRILAEKGLTDNVLMILDDIENIKSIFSNPKVKNHLDLSQPLGVLASSVFHFVKDDQLASEIVEIIHDNVVDGSCFAMVHGCHDGTKLEDLQHAKKVYKRTTTPIRIRSTNEISNLFGNFQLLEPQVVDAPKWRPDADQVPLGGTYERVFMASGMGVKNAESDNN